LSEGAHGLLAALAPEDAGGGQASRGAAAGVVGVGPRESVFSIEAPAIVYGAGAIAEVGAHVAALLAAGVGAGATDAGPGSARVAVFTDARVAALPFFASACAALRAAGLDAVVYDAVHVEPTDASFESAARFAREGRFDA
jgi:alcohol dehydrogenase class IV